MNLSERQELYRQVAARWGIQACLDVAVEECAELIQAICKVKRALNNEILGFAKKRGDLIEEIADVEIIIEQLKTRFDISDRAVELIKAEKIERMKKLL